MTIRVIIVDDHAVVRSGLRHVLEAEDDIEVVAEAGDMARIGFFRATRLAICPKRRGLPNDSR